MSAQIYETMNFMEQFRFCDSFRGTAFIGRVKSMPIHMHNGPELMYVLKGELEVKISFHSYNLKAGDFLFVNSYEAHSIKVLDMTEILFLQMEGDLFGGERFIHDPNCDGWENRKAVETVKEYMVKSYLLLATEFQKQESDETLRKIVNVCKRSFREMDGSAAEQIGKAELLLLGSDLAVQEVGRQADFSAHACFVKRFKECFGMAPSAYRKKYGEQIYPKQPMEWKEMLYAPAYLTELVGQLQQAQQERYLEKLSDALEQVLLLCELISADEGETKRLRFWRKDNWIRLHLKKRGKRIQIKDDKSA